MRLRLLVLLPLLLILVPVAYAGVTYQPDILPEIGFAYDQGEYLFRLTYKSYYLNIQPYAVYDNETYTLKQIVPYIKNHYPAVSYRQAIQIFAEYHRWGFWLEKLPDEVSSRLSEVGYRLVDTNIPRDWFEVEHDPEFNVSRVTVGGRFTLDFGDLAARYNVDIDAEGVHVTGITGLTDIDMDPITYSAPTITVTGTNAGAPWTFLDIWNADQAGGWGVVFNNGGTGRQFQFNAKIVIGDGSTTTLFTDTNKQIVFIDGIATSASTIFFNVRGGATVNLGEIQNSNLKTGKNGCEFILLETTYTDNFLLRYADATSILNLYSCTLKYPNYANKATYIIGTGTSVTPNIWSCVFDGVASWAVRADYANDKFINHKAYNILSPRTGCTFYNIFCRAPLANLYLDEYTYTFTEIQSDTVSYFIRHHRENGQVYAIDCTPSSWTFVWGGAFINAITYRQYTFNLKVTDSAGAPVSGATVTLNRADNTPAFSVVTAGNGTIPEQTVTRGHYTQPTGDTLNDYGPFTLTIQADGFRDYTQPGIVLGDPVSWVLALQPPHYGGINPLFLLIFGIFGSMVLMGTRGRR